MRGITIVDLTRVLAGPWASQQLADQGATVIKVEPPTGDETRQFGPIVNGESTYYLSANRNKRALTINLKTPEGRSVAERLIMNADVVLENFRPGVAERLVAEQPRVQHPKLVYVSIKAFGSDGDPAWTRRPGYDLVLQAMGGAVSFTGFPESPPSKCGLDCRHANRNVSGSSRTDRTSQRERSGVGQRLEINMMQAQAAALSYHATRFTVTGEEEGTPGGTRIAVSRALQYLSVPRWTLRVLRGNDRICHVSSPHCGSQKTSPSGRQTRVELPGRGVDAAVQERLGQLTVAQADQLCADADIPAGPVQSIQSHCTSPGCHTGRG